MQLPKMIASPGTWWAGDFAPYTSKTKIDESLPGLETSYTHTAPRRTLTVSVTAGWSKRAVPKSPEPALVDHQRVSIGALEPSDGRTFDLAVAGPAALLVAKIIKISERLRQADRQPDRLKEKDALDTFRLLKSVDTGDLALYVPRLHGSTPYQYAFAQGFKSHIVHSPKPCWPHGEG